MADITMCKGEGCPLKDNCYRHKAVWDSYQSIFSETPYSTEKEQCEYFWLVEEKDEAE